MRLKLIINGELVEAPAEAADEAFDLIESAGQGRFLVALSCDRRVIVRWVDAACVTALTKVTSSLNANVSDDVDDSDVRFLDEIVSCARFDSVAVESSVDLTSSHSVAKEEYVESGKRPPSYRRWLSRLKSDWVRRAQS